MLRHQLAVYSPLSVGHVLRAAAGTFMGADPRPQIATGLRQDFRADRAVLYGSGTQALQVAIEAARSRSSGGDIVALPAFGCYDLASAAVGADARVALYDIDPETLAPDWASLERTLAAGAAAAVIVALYGIPVDWDAAESLARPYGAVLVEDAAQGHGASWRSHPLGSLGTLSIVSFGRGKGWTGGRGGALLVRESGVTAGPVRKATWKDDLSTLGGSLAQALLGRPALYGLPMAVPGLGLGETRFHPPVPPRVLPRSAASLLSLTQYRSKLEAEERCAAAEALINLLIGAPSARPIRVLREARPGYLRLPVRLPRGMDSFSDPDRARRLGAAASYPTTLASLSAVHPRLVNVDDRWPGAEELVGTLVTLPVHSRVSNSERNEVVQLLASAR